MSARRSRSISCARSVTAVSPICITRSTGISGSWRIRRAKAEYQKIVDSIADSLDFFERVSGGRAPHEVTSVDFFAAHEGLLMHYEQAQTRYIERQKRWYNLATHMPWIGMRTAQLDGAHVEFFRGVSNPMGVKIGPAMTDGMAAGPGHHAQSAEHAGTPHHHPPLRREGCGEGPAQDDQGRARNRSAGAVDLRSDARQHRDQLGWPQDAALREHPARTGAVVPDSRGEWLVPRRRAHRAHGRKRHGMHRRRARPHRCRPRACVQVDGRSAAQLRTGARTGDAHRQARPDVVDLGHAVRTHQGSEGRPAHHHQSGRVAERAGRCRSSPSSKATVSASTSRR